jgi:Trypsin-co-occurring domain 2
LQIPLADAIRQLRDELREAILEGKDKDIVFTPNGIDIELSVTDQNGQPIKVRSDAVPKGLS